MNFNFKTFLRFWKLRASYFSSHILWQCWNESRDPLWDSYSNQRVTILLGDSGTAFNALEHSLRKCFASPYCLRATQNVAKSYKKGKKKNAKPKHYRIFRVCVACFFTYLPFHIYVFNPVQDAFIVTHVQNISPNGSVSLQIVGSFRLESSPPQQHFAVGISAGAEICKIRESLKDLKCWGRIFAKFIAYSSLYCRMPCPRLFLSLPLFFPVDPFPSVESGLAVCSGNTSKTAIMICIRWHPQLCPVNLYSKYLFRKNTFPPL